MDVPIVVVGGGQAALATGYHLRRAGLRALEDFVILDELGYLLNRQDDVAEVRSASDATGALRELAVDSTGPLAQDVDYRLIALARERDGQQATTREERRLVESYKFNGWELDINSRSAWTMTSDSG